METTWLAVIASIFMGAGAACVFLFAVRRDYFRDMEDAKYQVFWSDIEELVESTAEENTHEHGRKKNQNG